jgi:hypothetical protein
MMSRIKTKVVTHSPVVTSRHPRLKVESSVQSSKRSKYRSRKPMTKENISQIDCKLLAVVVHFMKYIYKYSIIIECKVLISLYFFYHFWQCFGHFGHILTIF